MNPGTVRSDEDGWRRLDPRMLLIGPVRVLKELAVPALIALIGIGTSDLASPLWLVPALLLPFALGALPWLTTRYRITTTAFQRRSGLLNRQQLTAPLDRVRSVDLQASLLHRALGLAKVEVGTGVDDTRIVLDSLSSVEADRLRTFLLVRAGFGGRLPASASDEPVDAEAGGARARESTPTGPGPGVPPGRGSTRAFGLELARIDWAWLRYAPFSLSRLVVVAGILGVASQFADELPILDADHVDAAWRWLLGFALPLVLLVALCGALAAWVVISVAGYVLQWWDFRLVREHGTLRLTAGLLTTRSTSVEEARVRGVELREPLLLRLVGGAELFTWATGVGTGGVSQVLPPCPAALARGVGHTILSEDHALNLPLRRHGPAARRRCHVRSQWVTLIAVAATLGSTVLLDLPAGLPLLVGGIVAVLAMVFAEQAYAHLGHEVTGTHLLSGSGALTRRRQVVEADGVIGWVFAQSPFQRRAGLATLVATTAAGAESVRIRDLPLSAAVELAGATTPELMPYLAVAP